MTVNASRPPPDLDARYAPFPQFSTWPRQDQGLELFDLAAAELLQLAALVGPEQTNRAVEVAVRAAAFDTGAIEGLYSTNRGVTFSVAEQAAAWEAVAAQEAGRDAVRHFRAQLAGFELVMDAVTGATPITSAWLRALHETICGGQETFRALTAVGWQEVTLPKGEFKQWPNHVREADGGWRSYAPPAQTADEVQLLVDEIASPEFTSAHPIVQAAFAHHALVWIHPFADGNGRVARALASVFLYRAARIPLHIWADQRGRYLDALRATDSGEPAAFVRFVRDVSVDTVRLVVLRLRPAARRALPAKSRRIITVPVTDDADDALLARRVLLAVAEHARSRAADATVDIVDAGQAGLASPPPQGYEPLPGAVLLSTDRMADKPARISVLRDVRPESPYQFALVIDGVPPLPLRRDQLDPAISEVTAAQLEAWVDDLIDQLTAG